MSATIRRPAGRRNGVAWLRRVPARRRSGAFLLIVTLIACGRSPVALLAEGAWGGPGALMIVGNAATTVELDCAHGTLPGRVAFSDGAFTISGEFILDPAGPDTAGGQPDRHAAVYAGVMRGDVLDLTIALDNELTLGPFSLLLDRPATLHKCR